MTMRDKDKVTFTSCGSAIKSNQIIRDEIEKQIAEFKRKGGKINDLSPSKDIISAPVFESDLQKTIKEKKRMIAQKRQLSREFAQSPISYMDGGNRANKKASSGHQNSSMTKLKDGTVKYAVVIGATTYGSFTDKKEAIRVRDDARKTLGMSKALY